MSRLQVFLIRHGETAWSLTGQHTGRTDIALTAHGEDEARELLPRLAQIQFSCVLVSPRLRTRQTCELAGLGWASEIEPDLAEWDFGDYEGLHSVDIRKTRPNWDAWRDGSPGGEMPADVSLRVDRLIARLNTMQGNVALFSHAKLGASLAARWIGLPVIDGQHFILHTASLSILGHDAHHSDLQVITLWNETTSQKETEMNGSVAPRETPRSGRSPLENNKASSAKISPLAGKPARPDQLVDVSKLLSAYYSDVPDHAVPEQRVAFGTSGHRGSAFKRNFNEWHVLAISQAICDFRKMQDIRGPLYLGIDTHALSGPACVSALEVLAANGVEVMLAEHDEFTPTPAISHAILNYNRGRTTGLADGIVITPSHNPPEDGGYKYNPPNGGPADTRITGCIEASANSYLEGHLKGIQRIPYERALSASTTHRHDYLNTYVNDLGSILDMEVIRGANLRMGVDPLGGAGVHYWARIAERYGLNLTVVNDVVDPTFRFMTVDWDGQIRMDPSSSYAMRSLIGLKDRFDISFACDTDHDRHGIVTRNAGLLPPNHYLAVAIFYLFQHRPHWSKTTAVGKTVVSSQMIDRITAKLGRKLYEVPVGFKWFVAGLLDGSLGFGGEESAGASFSRLDGSVWTTDKDGIVAALLSAEITARLGRDPGEVYAELAREFGDPVYERIDASATAEQKRMLAQLAPEQVRSSELAGERIQHILNFAPGNNAPIGGLKVISEGGWFAARPSGTEDIYKIYAESFRGADHLSRILEEAQCIVGEALLTQAPQPNPVAAANSKKTP